MDVSAWAVGVGIGAVAAAAAGWAWLRQRRLVDELARRLEASEHSRLDLEAHAHQVDDQLASMADALARQQAAMAVAQAGPAAPTAASGAPIEALLRHLGDQAPVAADSADPGDPGDPDDNDWVDTEPGGAADEALEAGPPLAFAETMPAELDTVPGR